MHELLFEVRLREAWVTALHVWALQSLGSTAKLAAGGQARALMLVCAAGIPAAHRSDSADRQRVQSHDAGSGLPSAGPEAPGPVALQPHRQHDRGARGPIAGCTACLPWQASTRKAAACWPAWLARLQAAGGGVGPGDCVLATAAPLTSSACRRLHIFPGLSWRCWCWTAASPSSSCRCSCLPCAPSPSMAALPCRRSALGPAAAAAAAVLCCCCCSAALARADPC